MVASPMGSWLDNSLKALPIDSFLLWKQKTFRKKDWNIKHVTCKWLNIDIKAMSREATSQIL